MIHKVIILTGGQHILTEETESVKVTVDVDGEKVVAEHIVELTEKQAEDTQEKLRTHRLGFDIINKKILLKKKAKEK